MIKKAATDLQRKLSQIHRDAEERDAERRANRLGVSYIDIRHTPVSVDALKLLPKEVAFTAKAAVVETKSREVAVAFYDSNSAAAHDVVRSLETKGYTVRPFITSVAGLQEAWRFYEFVLEPTKEITGKVIVTAERMEALKGQGTFTALKTELG